MLVVPYRKTVERLKEKYGSSIETFVYYIPDTNSEFQSEFNSNYNLTYDDIEMYRNVQFKCFRYNTRYIYNDNNNNNIYYTALKYFLGYFNNNKIDLVISKIMEHGAISDSLIFEIAKNKNIPVYIISMNTGFAGNGLFSILDYNANVFVDVSSINKEPVDFDSFISTLNVNYSGNRLIKLPFFKIIKKFISKKNKTFLGCIKWFYEYKIKLYCRYIKYSIMRDLYKIREETSIWQMIKGRIYLTRLKIYYKRISIKKIIDDNYIFFPLHMEPEAANLARTTLGCQQFIIEQISQILPEGYYLYIKEHPDQFASIQMEKYYYKGMYSFRNIDFYKRITKLKNVRVVSVYTPSSKLISQSSVVLSIAGSALIEAVAKNVPIIVFGDGASCVELLKDAFVVKELGKLKEIMNKIKEGYVPDYSDFSMVMNKYVLTIKNLDFCGVNDLLNNLFCLLYKLSN